MMRSTSSAAVLLAVFAALMFGAVARAQADNLYSIGANNTGTWNFGTVDSFGATTSIATGLSLGGNATAERLMFAPDGTLYTFDLSENGQGGAWGTINPATGAFKQIGNLNTSLVYPGGDGFTEADGDSFAFGPSGALYVVGWGPDYRCDFGTLSLTTGAFTKISASPLGLYGNPGSIAAWGNKIYYLGANNTGTWNFGTVDSFGATTSIATGLSLGGNATAERLMFAPDGTLYTFDLSENGQGGAWGTINPATGAFKQIGNLNTSLVYPGGDGFTEADGDSFAFGPSGALYVVGWGPDYRCDFGTLSLTTGAFTKISASPLGLYGNPGSIAAPIPEPSTFVLLGVGVLGLLACRRLITFRRGPPFNSVRRNQV